MRNESPYCKQNANIFLRKHGLTCLHKKKISPVAMHRHTDILATGDMYTNSGVESIRYEQVRCLFRHGPMLGFLHFQEV